MTLLMGVSDAAILSHVLAHYRLTAPLIDRIIDSDSVKLPSGSTCWRARTTRVKIDGGRISLTISKNHDGTLKFSFGSGK